MPGDMADAEAIAEATCRPTMRFVEIKTPEQQGPGMIFRLRDMLAGQRPQMISSLRGHLPEFGIVAGKGRETVARLRLALAAEEASESLPASVRAMSQLCLEQIDGLSKRISDLDAQIQAASRLTPLSARLQKMPGIGPVTAMAIAAFAPPMEAFGRGRDFSAWLGLVPRQHSSGGKQRLGRTSKSGQSVAGGRSDRWRDPWQLRRLLIIGAMAVISSTKARPPAGRWLGRILARKPRMLAAIALANSQRVRATGPGGPRTARVRVLALAMMTKDEEFRGGPQLAG